MKKIATFLLSLIICVTTFAQKDVTKFLGFPVDGSKSEMIRNLKSKGFKLTTVGDTEMLTGRFNGHNVQVYISTENGKVSRIMVCDENNIGETDIKIRFNRLCSQFKDNGKYLSIEDFTIPDSEDISYEMDVHNKRYEAVFYQLPEGDTLENLKESIYQKVQAKYTPEQLENASDELREEIISECAIELFNAIQNKPVWFIITEHNGKYFITMFYDNELNRAHGEDL